MLLRRDGSAFERLIEASRNSVTSITLAICRDVTASEDVAQEVYLTAWRRLPELRNPASFLPWIRQIARLTARTWVRDQRSRARRLQVVHDSEDQVDTLIARAADPAAGPEGSLLERERASVILRVLDALPDESREVVILYYREGRSSQQVARLLGLSDGAVRKRLQRAREILRAEVLERFSEAARRSAPGAAFTASVLAATASAPVASAAGLAGVAKSGWLPALAALSGAALGWAGGSAGVVIGLRRDFEQALDEGERKQLRALRASALLAIAIACVGFVLQPIHDHWSGPTLVYVGLVATLAMIYLWWLPKIVRRRYLVEEGGDEVAVAKRLARRRRQALVGLVLGGLSGAAGLVSSGLL